MSNNTTLIVHVTGTEETREIPKDVVRAGIAQGQIKRSQLIWSPIHNAWKQVRELPHLLPSQKLAPAPVRPTGGTVPMPVIAQGQPVAASATPRVAVKAGGTPVAAVKAHNPVLVARSTVVEEDTHEFSLVKWIFVGAAVLICGAIGANYFYVEQPLLTKMSTTPYSNVMVYAHLGAFVQPGALVIHIVPSATLSKEKVVDFLVTLARNTPQPTNLFERVSITTGVTSHYTLTGFAWKELGDMASESEEEKENYILGQLMNSNGQPLYAPTPLTNETSRQAMREKVWAGFLSYFGS